MALLGNFKKNQIERILNDILKKLRSLIDSEEQLTKYLNQLVILARIRNLEKIISQKLADMPILYNVEKDGLYLQGMEKGREEGVSETVWKFFKAGIAIEVIARTLDLTTQKVKVYIKQWEAKS